MKKLLLIFQIIVLTVSYSFSQNVGIGITAPAERLHVAGNIKADTLKPNAVKITTNAGTGKLLTSDAAGNASWQTGNTLNTNGGVGFGTWGDCSMNGISEFNPVADSTEVPQNQFGFKVAVSGNFAIISEPFALQSQGLALIYQFNGTNWVRTQTLSDPDGPVVGGYGFSGVAISDSFAVVTAHVATVGLNIGQGAAFVYKFNGNSWVFKQKITDPGGTALDFFGSSVSIADHNLIIGSQGDDVSAVIDQGSASIFHYDGTNWVFVQKIFDVTCDTNGKFGASVSISGNFAMVGANNDINGQGSADIYRLNGNAWILMKKITEPLANSGAALGASVSISGNYSVAGAPGNLAAYIYFFNGTQWVFQQRAVDDNRIFDGNSFGSSVSISGNYLLVGELAHDTGAINTNDNSGAAIIFSKFGPEWRPIQVVTDPAGRAHDELGTAVSIDATTKRFLISAPGYVNFSGKAIFGKIN